MFKRTFQKIKKIFKRNGFDAGIVGRFNTNWVGTIESIDWSLRTSLNLLQRRSRDLAINSSYGAKFIKMGRTNVVGPNGFKMQVRSFDYMKDGTKKMDNLANAAIERHFADWQRAENCDIANRLSFKDICDLYVTCLMRDGEVLIRKVYGEEAGKYGFQLQVLDIERLDVNKNEYLGDNRSIKMGVEVDKYNRPVAYWLLNSPPGDYFSINSSLRNYERVPASDIYHHFVSERAEQTRGYPWLTPSMEAIKDLGAVQHATLTAVRAGASKMGFFTTPDGDGGSIADAEGPRGELYSDMDPGKMGVLPPGVDFKPFDPAFPDAVYSDFTKTALRSISTGIGVSYNSLANDLEGVNFSSIRAGVLEDRDNWMAVQRFVIENFLKNVGELWLKMALLKSAITLPNGSALPVSKFNKFNQITWQARRWPWVDPLKDIQASTEAINNGLRSRRNVCADLGSDIDDVFNQLAEEEAMIQQLGLTIATPVNSTNPLPEEVDLDE
jgi:lambda family phage portal protein